jgi:eukaryotic-like serine/threonine-protein kinase
VSIPETLGHYRILGLLGRGGMGEVYAAEDTRLNRKIAVKVLPELVAGDPERRHRFEREAQAVAALNHPNIVTIHSVEEDQGLPFLTMELVEGQPLGDIVRAGQLSIDTLLRIGIGVSDALAAAHQRGITHRDIKPGNIMMTPDGRVKVLDFGLAKLREAEAEAAADAVTRIPTQDVTGEGRIIGTLAYMSPEQAEGKAVDQRSDIFSLGVVLHELATGEKPFKGETTVSLISSILKDTPTPITEINPALPLGLAKVIRRSLAKDPSRRYQTAIDLRNDLEDLKQEIDSGVTASVVMPRPALAPRRRLNPVSVIATLAMIAGVLALAYAYWSRRAPSVRSDFVVVERPARLTSSGNAALAAISPDGRYVAHVKNDPGAPSLWMRQTATTSDVQIVPPATVRYDGVTYSPEGNHVYYVTYPPTGGLGTLYRVPALGGTSEKIIEDVDSRVSFSPDRAQFTFTRGAPAEGTAFVMIANADGTNVRKLAQLAMPDQFMLNATTWSSDGKTVIAPAQSLRDGPHALIAAIDVATGTITQLKDRWTQLLDLEWVPGTNTFLVAGADFGQATPQLWQIAYPSGERHAITNDLNTYSSLSLSADRSSLATVQTERVANLWIANIDNFAAVTQITSGRGRGDGLLGMDWTPDGQVVFVSNAAAGQQLWMTERDGRNVRQLTAAQQEPVFSVSVTPDGRHVVFQRYADGRMRVWRMNLDGSDQKLLTDGTLDLAPVAAPGGIVYFARVTAGVPRPYKVSIEGGEAVALGDYNFRPIDVSADGSQLLGIAWNPEARRSVLGIMPAGGGVVRMLPQVPSFVGGLSPDGQWLLFPVLQRGGVRIERYDLVSNTSTPLGALPGVLFAGGLSPDGKRLALSRGDILSDVLLLTLKPRTE